MEDKGKTLYDCYRSACAERRQLKPSWEKLPPIIQEDWREAAHLFVNKIKELHA